MARYSVPYEDWSKEDLKKLGVLLNDLMTTLNRCYAGEDEEASWLRKFEGDLDGLIDNVESKSD